MVIELRRFFFQRRVVIYTTITFAGTRMSCQDRASADLPQASSGHLEPRQGKVDVGPRAYQK